MTSNGELFSMAFKLHTFGYSVIPSGAGKNGKSPSVTWEAYQKQCPTDDDLTRWHETLRPHLWGVVTGKVSGVVVIDADVKEAVERLESWGMKPNVHTPRGGRHYWIQHPGFPVITKAGILPSVDIRGDGGFVNVIGERRAYKDGDKTIPAGEYEIVEMPSPDKLIPWRMVPPQLLAAIQAKPQIAGPVTPGNIPQGSRNDRLFRLASGMRRQGASEDTIFAAVKKCYDTDCSHDPPMDDNELRTVSKQGAKYAPEAPKPSRELSQARVADWIKLTSGAFNVRDMWSELGIMSPEDRTHLRQILHRLTESNIIVKTAKDGVYRKIDTDKKLIDWQSADPTKFLPLWLPFGLHHLCKVFPKSIIIVAGSKNQGKTAFLMSCIMPNASNFRVDFFNSETGPEQLKERFAPLDIPMDIPAPFNVYERYDNFADVIEPDRLSIIDYLDMNSEVYLVGSEIDNIFRKLTTGCAIIGLQKPPGRDLAYGGAFSAKRAVVYISLDDRKMKLVYCKTPKNPRLNPNNMMWKYDFDDNGYFTNITRWSESVGY